MKNEELVFFKQHESLEITQVNNINNIDFNVRIACARIETVTGA